MQKIKNKKQKLSKNFVHYVEDSISKIIFFKNRKNIFKFMTEFASKGQTIEDGYWIDFYVDEGSFCQVDDSLTIEKYNEQTTRRRTKRVS